MKKYVTTILATILASTIPLSLSACHGIDTENAFNAISQPTPIPLSVKKGYYVAIQAAIGLEHTASIAVDSKLIKPGSPTAIKVADGLDKIHTAMAAADTAFKVGDAASLVDKVQKIEDTVAQVAPLLSGATHTANTTNTTTK